MARPSSKPLPISKNGYWPLYVPLYSAPFVYTNGFAVVTGKQYYGSLIGWVLFGTNGSSALNGTLVCSKGAVPGQIYYPNGFTNVSDLQGSSYVPPVVGQPALEIAGRPALTSASVSVVLDGGNLAAPLGVNAILTTNNTFVVQQPNPCKVKLQLVTKTGLLKGTFVNQANSNKVTNINGAVLQNVNAASGLFLGPSESGSVSLQVN